MSQAKKKKNGGEGKRIKRGVEAQDNGERRPQRAHGQNGKVVQGRETEETQ